MAVNQLASGALTQKAHQQSLQIRDQVGALAARGSRTRQIEKGLGLNSVRQICLSAA